MEIGESKQPIEYILKIPIKSIEERLLNNFLFLKDENDFNKFYSEFNIDDEEKIIINMWEEIINYIYEEIFHCMSLSISDLKKSTKIKDKYPSDFNKIIQYLIYNKKYIKNADLKQENFYSYNFPNLYYKKGIFSGLLNFIPNFINCKQENDNESEFEEETLIRNDLSKNYIFQKIPENIEIINYKIFKNHCNAILIILNDVLNEEGKEIISRDEFTNIIREKYMNENQDEGKFKLVYGLQFEEEVFYYLKMTKQIIIFMVNGNDYFIFIRPTKNKDDSVTEEDIKIAKELIAEFY
jgi:hypothetical protein